MVIVVMVVMRTAGRGRGYRLGIFHCGRFDLDGQSAHTAETAARAVFVTANWADRRGGICVRLLAVGRRTRRFRRETLHCRDRVRGRWTAHIGLKALEKLFRGRIQKQIVVGNRGGAGKGPCRWIFLEICHGAYDILDQTTRTSGWKTQPSLPSRSGPPCTSRGGNPNREPGP